MTNTLCRIRRLNRVLVALALGLGMLPCSLASAADSDVRSTPGSAIQTTLAERYYRSRDELTAAQKVRMPEFCDGMYIGPQSPTPVAGSEQEAALAAQSTYAEADSGSYWFEDRAFLEGNVTITQLGRRLLTSRAEVAMANRIINLPDPVELQDGEAVVVGTSGTADMASGAATLNDVQYVLLEPSMRGEAVQLKREESGDWIIHNGAVTRCDPGNSSWHVSARQIHIPKDEIFGIARGAVLRVKDVPVFYAPYISFPISDERVSGLLFPAFGYSSEDGLDLSLPYYLNLAPNYDATVVPRYFSKRGLGVEAELRGLGHWHSSALGLAYLPGDDQYNGYLSRDDFEMLFPGQSASFNPADRWLLALQHQGELFGLQSKVDYTAVSDRDYFHDLGTDLEVSSKIDLERRAELVYEREGLWVRLWAQRFQRLDEIEQEAYQRVPELEISYQGALFGPLQWSLSTEWVKFDRKLKGLTGRDVLTGTRAHLEPRLSLPLSWPYGFMKVTGGIRYTQYDLDSVQGVAGLPANFDESPNRQIGFGSVGGGLFFDRDLTWFGTRLVQTLEPQVYYLYQGFEDQRNLPLFDTSELTFGYRQLFRDNRFSGIDRIGDANQLSVGLTTRFLGAATGKEIFSASIGQIAYFDNRRVTLSDRQTQSEKTASSAYAAEFKARLARRWSINGTTIWDPHENRFEEAAAAFQYRRDAQRILNLGYRHRAQEGVDIDQADASIYWPLTRRVSVLARWNYDLDNDRTIEAIGGLEYNDCCWQVRLVARRFIDNPSNGSLVDVQTDEGIYIQFVFKGLAGFGDQLESVLQHSIKGYQPKEY